LRDSSACISALESGGITLNLQPVPLRHSPKNSGRPQNAYQCEGRETRQRFARLTATADANRLEQILANLVDNAIKYGRADGTVIVGGQKKRADKMKFFVQDDGPGIPPESLDRVFSGFNRVTRPRAPEQGGNRPWFCPCQTHRAEPWRQGLGEKRAGQGHDLFLPRCGRKIITIWNRFYYRPMAFCNLARSPGLVFCHRGIRWLLFIYPFHDQRSACASANRQHGSIGMPGPLESFAMDTLESS